MECDSESSVPDWVIEHPETFVVFNDLGIDTSCGGKSLRFLCQQRDLDLKLVLNALRRATNNRNCAQTTTSTELKKDDALSTNQPADSKHISSGDAFRAVSEKSPQEAGPKVLVKASTFEVIRLTLPTGKEIPPHKARGELIVQCLDGTVEFSCFNQTRHLSPGDLIWLPADELHAVRAIFASTLLVTKMRPQMTNDSHSDRRSL